MNIKQVIFLILIATFYIFDDISCVKEKKTLNKYNPSRYNSNNVSTNKKFTKRYCYLKEKEKVEIPNLDILRQNLSRRVLRVTALEEYPYTYFEHKNGTTIGKGATFKIFDILKKKYKFNYTIVLPENNRYGSTTDKNDNMFELLTTGKADMGIGYIPPMKDYNNRMLYSSQINLAAYHIMMVKPRGSVISRGLLAPFSSAVWIATAVFFLIMGPVIYAAIIFHREFGKDEKIETLGQIVWFVYGALVRQGHSVNITPINDSTRILFATWWIFVTILTTFYTANLVAYLARSEFPFSISTIEDFVKTNTKLLVKKGGPVEYALKTDQSLALLKQRIDDKGPIFGGSYNDSQHMMEALIKKNYAIIASLSALKHLMYDYYMSKRVSAKEFNAREHCPFILSKNPIFWGIQSFVYDCKSQLNFLFDKDLSYLVEAGITLHLKDSELPIRSVCDLSKQKVETQLKVQDLEITFIIVFIGFLVSFAVLLFEIFYVKRQIVNTTAESQKGSTRSSSRVSVISDILHELMQQNPRRHSASTLN